MDVISSHDTREYMTDMFISMEESHGHGVSVLSMPSMATVIRANQHAETIESRSNFETGSSKLRVRVCPTQRHDKQEGKAPSNGSAQAYLSALHSMSGTKDHERFGWCGPTLGGVQPPNLGEHCASCEDVL